MARVISGDGYYMVSPPLGYKGKTYIGGRYVYEHRLIAEQIIGRMLETGEIVHHKDGDKLNNSVENLEVLTKEIHDSHHSILRMKFSEVECTGCGKKITIQNKKLKERSGRNKMGVFCGRSCATKYQFRVKHTEITQQVE